jgi:hypothetical protein
MRQGNPTQDFPKAPQYGGWGSENQSSLIDQVYADFLPFVKRDDCQSLAKKELLMMLSNVNIDRSSGLLLSKKYWGNVSTLLSYFFIPSGLLNSVSYWAPPLADEASSLRHSWRMVTILYVIR